jgi:hypothetical protein
MDHGPAQVRIRSSARRWFAAALPLAVIGGYGSFRDYGAGDGAMGFLLLSMLVLLLSFGLAVTGFTVFLLTRSSRSA